MAENTTISPIARMRLSADLIGMLKQQATVPDADPMRALKRAKISASIAATLKALGVDTGAAKRVGEAFASDGAPDIPETPRVTTAHLYDFDPDRKHSQRKKDNAEAMSILRALDAGEITSLTDAQKSVLARYSGTGGNLVGDNGKRGSAYEYYTPKPIAAGMWDMLKELGFGGGKVLDPCSATGIFGATAPANAAIDAVELNETSGRINALVNGGAGYSATVSPFEAVASRTPDEIYDAVITNVPFGSVHDRGSNRKIDSKYQDQPLETYFILRSMEKLKPGGLAAFIVPPRVVSAKGGREEQLRISVSYMAEFMGAYRLPNSVFGAADADTITDVIVFRKFSRQTLTKIDELKEQNPSLLVSSNVLWQEFIAGTYFQGEGRKYVLGEFQAKDPNKFRDVDRVVSEQSVPNIAKLLRKFPGSRIDWKAIEESETAPILYDEGDTITLAGQTLQMKVGVWVDIGKSADDSRYDGIGEVLGTATLAVSNKVDWTTASAFVKYMSDKSLDLDIPSWLRMAARDLQKLDESDHPKYWGALSAGLAAVEVSRAHGETVGFNYLEEYAVLSEAIQAASVTAKKSPAAFSRDSKSALQKIGIVYSRKSGFSDVWRGNVKADVTDGQVLSEDAQVEAVKYQTNGTHIEIDVLKGIYGDDFDALKSDDWCVSADGKTAQKADDYYIGNLADFQAKIDAQIAAASGDLKEKLIRQRAAAMERVSPLNPENLSFNLFSPFVTIEEKAEFLRRFMHPGFVVAFDDVDGKPTIVCDIGTPKNERERQFKRFAEYLKKGNLSTRTKEEESKADPNIDAQRRKMLRDMAAQASAQFDQWVKANPVVMERLRKTANDPQSLYFDEVDDNSPLDVPGMHSDWKLHGYQNAYVRKEGRSFGGINGFDVGLGKTATAAAAVLYVQSIGVKKKTIFVVPNSVLSNWRKELLIGEGKKGEPKYKPPVFASDAGCLFVGLDIDLKTGKASVDPSNYARDFSRILENKHNKIFCTLEAFKTIPLKDETISKYEEHLSRVDPSFAGSDKNSDSERAASKLADATSGTGDKSSAIPFFEDMGIDSIVFDEGHMYKNGKSTIEFSGAKFLSVSEASQRGLDVQIKSWYIREGSELKDGVSVLSATPITNSPLEIYSMLCLAVGEKRVHDLCLGAKGADAFMEVMCQIEDDEEMSVDGRVKPYRVFRGLQNVDILRNALHSIATIKTAADVKEAGDDIKLPDSPECKTAVQLEPKAKKMLETYKMAYRAARFLTGAAGKNAAPPTDEETQALQEVSERFGEPNELIGHPFNLINKMSLLIADPELDERASFYKFMPSQAELAGKVVADFNKLGKNEFRSLPGQWTDAKDVVGNKTVRDGDNETVLLKIRIQAKIESGRIVVDTMDSNMQYTFEEIADKAGLDLDCSIPPKLAALVENCRKEEANPRSSSGRVKQLIFCDILPMHSKIKRILNKRLGVLASSIAIVTGQSIKNPEQLQGVQDGFNAEGEDNKYRYVVANEKAEVGINLQKGTQAIHHLTIGWTPDSQHQRNGRGVRQGNTTGRVNIYQYDADGTFDEYKRVLTNKKADWIGAVMDKNGGNNVAVSGGLTNEQYNELIESMGDDGAIRAIRERAELEEARKRADSARARQVINLKTAQAQSDFRSKFNSAESWIADKIMQVYDLEQTLKVMRIRASHGKAESQIKLKTRIAELDARIGGMRRDIEESAEISEATYRHGVGVTAKTALALDDLMKLESWTASRSAAKQREYLEGRVKRCVTAKPGTTLVADYASEIAAANAMEAEAFKDFERIAKEGGYPVEAVDAHKAGDALILDGKLYYRGMFCRDKGGILGVLKDKVTITALRDKQIVNVSVASAVTSGKWEFIYQGMPEYQVAAQDAARLDDAVESATAEEFAAMYSTINPDVSQYRKNQTLARYRKNNSALPAPYFKYPVFDGYQGMSEALSGVAKKQREIIVDWVNGGAEFVVSGSTEIGHEYSYGAVAEGFAEYAKAAGVVCKPFDFVLLKRGDATEIDSSSVPALFVKSICSSLGNWPKDDGEAEFSNAQSQEQIEEIAQRMMAEATPFIDMSQYRFSDVAPFGCAAKKSLAEKRLRDAQNPVEASAEQANPNKPAGGIKIGTWVSKSGERRVYFNGVPRAGYGTKLYAVEDSGDDWQLKVNADRGALNVTKDELLNLIDDDLMGKNGGDRVRTFSRLWELSGGDKNATVPTEPIEAPAMAGGVAPNARGLIGIVGDTRPHKDTIKDCAKQAGGYAKWNGSSERWEVPAASWGLIVKNHSDAAKALQVVAV